MISFVKGLPFEALYFDGQAWQTSWPDVASDAGRASSSLFVVFHGYGANAWDLTSLVYALGSRQRWLFINGLHSLNGRRDESGMMAWFPIPLSLLQKSATSPHSFSLCSYPLPDKKKLNDYTDQVLLFLQDQSFAQIFLMGFSQGAMVATHLYPKWQEYLPLAGLVIFSGVLVDEAALEQSWSQAPSVAQIKLKQVLFQSHGHDDEILFFNDAEKLFQKLSPYFAKHRWVPFSGGHSIPAAVLDTFSRFIAPLLETY